MYNLPSPKAVGSGLPLHDHTAFMLVTALMHEDLDDQQDTVRGALEIDPLLATWTVCVADRMSGAQLTSMLAASRWLAKHLLELIDDPAALLDNASLGAEARVAWRQLAVNSVTVARRAFQLAAGIPAAAAAEAFWLGMLCETKQQLDALAELNGNSLLHDFRPRWPTWVSALQLSIRESAAGRPTEYSVARAMDESAKQLVADDLVRGEERELWFRSYPEFRMLAPLLIKKLRRLHALEEQFEDALRREKLAARSRGPRGVPGRGRLAAAGTIAGYGPVRAAR